MARTKVKHIVPAGPVKNYAEEVAQYVEKQGGWKDPNLERQALDCQARIEALGYEWDYARGLWRAPVPIRNYDDFRRVAKKRGPND